MFPISVVVSQLWAFIGSSSIRSSWWVLDGCNIMIQYRDYHGGRVHLTPKEVARSEDGWTIVVRTQPDLSWMVAAINLETGLPFGQRVPFVDSKMEIHKAVQMELRYLAKMGMGGDMASSSRYRRPNEQRLIEAWGPTLNREASVQGTVEGFLLVLSGWLTQYDQRLSVKRPNPYRLGHFLGAVQNARKTMARYMKADVRDPGVALQLKKALMGEFTHSGVAFDMPPVNKLSKAIDAYVAGGSAPNYKMA